MGISRQRRKRRSINDTYIIHSKRHILKEIIAHLVNLIMWIYVIIVLLLFVSACLDYNTDAMRT